MQKNNVSPVWHPFTQHGIEPPMKRIVKAHGAFLYDENNQKILDAISSWWVVTHGHCHPVIMNAIRKTTENLDQIIFADFTHEPAEKLARELIALAPKNLDYVFYSDSGSTSVEVAVKMALGFFKHTNQSRTKIVVMEHGYHGDTIGAMSLSERGVFNETYEPLLFEVARLPFPEKNLEQLTLDVFETLCKKNDVAALLVEPLMLGAGGFKCYDAWVLKELKRIAENHDVLLIADEVLTGWGRTGALFACEHAGISPDILCTAKGLTGGALPLAATLASKKIFDAHFSKDRTKQFFHSSSYTANPIACSAALANIDIWKSEPVFQRLASLTQSHETLLKSFLNHPHFINVRQLGTIAAIDLNISSTGYLSDVQPRLRKFFKEKNILLRPLGNVIYLMPPYCVTHEELKIVYDAIHEAADIMAVSHA